MTAELLFGMRVEAIWNDNRSRKTARFGAVILCYFFVSRKVWELVNLSHGFFNALGETGFQCVYGTCQGGG